MGVVKWYCHLNNLPTEILERDLISHSLDRYYWCSSRDITASCSHYIGFASISHAHKIKQLALGCGYGGKFEVKMSADEVFKLQEELARCKVMNVIILLL